ncbi:putative F-box/LRR-repeat/kelch-repeat protein At1g11620 [Daucus carota subsp. sativus]|uniref:putative F-box/LRR-repeat/kelch-repeat protein At1g11620 n=1 Tax=Daucus carota subsp. sativus TaxID=79200 RepID=UPI0007F04900|nr:PREDICTED: putative F-box/LRR-repeat/kelch-repeat protein At1g11620 [Daucus carota subsp. sativus]
MASINHLAEDLIFEILSWLPVLSLLRCISVCKSWKSIISNPKFIQAHLAISQQKQHPFSTLRVVTKSDESQDLFMDTLGENSVKLSLPRYIAYERRLLICSCNGLVILSDRHVVLLYIWNPLIRLGKLLPPAHYLHIGVVNKIGFGFDSLSSDYKILRVLFGRFSDLFDGEEKKGLVAELYSYNADSWKPIQVPKEIQGFKFDPISECVCVDGRALCLPGTDGILSFDLHDEVFRMHKYPASGEIISEVLDFEGSIALILRSGERASVLTLWALDEVEGNLSWTEKFNIIEPAKRIAYVLIYLGDGKFVARDHSRACFFYDMKKGTFVQFRIHMSAVQFSGSLLSLKGFERQD